MPYGTANELADNVRTHLESLGVDSNDIEYGGSLRRKAETVGDVDVAVFDLGTSTETWLKLIEMLRNAGHNVETEYSDPTGKVRKMPMGDRQTSFLVDGNNVDIKQYDPNNRGAMMIHITGSKDFNVGMRAWLKKYGWSFSQAGLKNEKGEVIAAENEEDIFKKMGMEFIPPEERTNWTPPQQSPPGVQVPQQPEQGGKYFRPNVPQDVMDRLPDQVKQQLRTMQLPTKDENGVWVPRDFLTNKQSRHKYYRSRGVLKIPDYLLTFRTQLSVILGVHCVSTAVALLP